MPEKKQGSSGKPIAESINELVGKVIPERFLATAFVAAVGLVFVLFVLMLVGFLRSPEKAAEAARLRAQDALGEVEKKLEQSQSSLGETRRQAATFNSQLQRAQAEKQRAEELLGRAEKVMQEERERSAAARQELGEARGTLRENQKQIAVLENQLQRRERDVQGLEATKGKLEAQLAAVNKQYLELQREKDAAAKVEQRAREAFEKIIQTVSTVEDPEKRLETLEKLRTNSAADVEGTIYMARLDSMLERAHREIEVEAAREAKQARIDARQTYESAMRRAQMASSHQAAMDILTEAKEGVKGTAFELQIHNEMERRQNAHVLDVARDAYENVLKQIRNKPIEYDQNIEAVKEALTKAKETRFQPLLEKQLTNLKAQRLEAIGKSLYDQALVQIDRSPKDHAANVAALRELKAKAAGSRHERAITKLLARQEALLARGTK